MTNVTPTQLQRLREIENRQQELIAELVELYREEQQIKEMIPKMPKTMLNPHYR